MVYRVSLFLRSRLFRVLFRFNLRLNGFNFRNIGLLLGDDGVGLYLLLMNVGVTESIRIVVILLGLLTNYCVNVFLLNCTYRGFTIDGYSVNQGGVLSVHVARTILIFTVLRLTTNIGGRCFITLFHFIRGDGDDESAHAVRRIYERASGDFRGILLSNLLTGLALTYASRRRSVESGRTGLTILIYRLRRVTSGYPIPLTLKQGTAPRTIMLIIEDFIDSPLFGEG